MNRYSRMALMTACVILISAFSFSDAQAQSKKKKKKGTATATTPPPAPKPPFEELEKKVKGMEQIKGLFTFYRDTLSGSLFMEIDSSHIDNQFIYFCYTENGPVTTGHNRGSFRETKVFTIKKWYNRIEFVTDNNRFYFDSSSALYKAKDANVVEGMMVSEKIAAVDKTGNRILISADNIFLKDILHQVKPTVTPAMAALGLLPLGNLNPAKTRYENIKSYPENSDIIVKYVFDNPMPRGTPGYAAEGRYMEVILQHSLIKVPDNNFKPRFDDPRVGYFTTQTNNMTTFDAINYRDFIHRWNLEKKDPTLAISEPVKPITYWIENTTPVEYRSVIEKALLAWNIAFEKAGFKNAIEVKIQPDDADWDAGDIRYNVLRWTSSPNPPFGGYGPSFVNPLTGEILGADIMLEFVFLTGRMQRDQIFKLAGMPLSDPMEYLNQIIALAEHHHNHEHDHDDAHHHCMAGSAIQRQIQFGSLAMQAMGKSEQEIGRFVEEALYYLILHEVGHTLGLSHNMRASQYLSPKELQDINITKEKGVIASVMDYPALNFANEKGREVQQYNTQPGPYDIWAIVYGYSPALEDDESEQNRLNAILARAVEKELRFGNDADDMRAPGKGIDPRVNIFDLSNDALLFSSERMKLVERVMETLEDKYVQDGKSYHELRNAFFVLSGEYATAADVVSRYIGGVQAERLFAGQEESSKPLTPTPLSEQKRAMKILTEQVFAPDAMKIPEKIIPYLQPQRRGFGFFSNTEDPKLHDRYLTMQAMPLNHILAFTTLKRISDSRMYGNVYSLSEVFKDLNNAIFNADIRGNVNTVRQNLQIYYLQLLDRNINGSMSSFYDNLSKAAMLVAIQDVRRMVQAGLSAGNEESKNHKRYLLHLTDEILEKSKR